MGPSVDRLMAGRIPRMSVAAKQSLNQIAERYLGTLTYRMGFCDPLPAVPNRDEAFF